MMIDVVVRDIDEIKLLCSLHEVVISDEVVVSYVNNLRTYLAVYFTIFYDPSRTPRPSYSTLGTLPFQTRCRKLNLNPNRTASVDDMTFVSASFRSSSSKLLMNHCYDSTVSRMLYGIFNSFEFFYSIFFFAWAEKRRKKKGGGGGIMDREMRL